MLSHNDLKKGVEFIIEDQPYKVVDSSFVVKGRGGSVVQAKIKNLITGNVLSKTFHATDEIQETNIEIINIKFIYTHKNKYVFSEIDNPGNRFELPKEVIGEAAMFLKSNEIVSGLSFEGKIINISLPVKVQLEVKEAPPGVKGDRAQGGTKVVVLETGAKIDVPLFVGTGDMIEINTEIGKYVRRVDK